MVRFKFKIYIYNKIYNNKYRSHLEIVYLFIYLLILEC